MLSLVPRSVAKGKARKAAPTTSVPVKPLQPLDLKTAIPSPDQNQGTFSDDWEAIVALVTCTITSCIVSNDFALKLRTPQGYVAVDTLLDQLGTRHQYTPASIAMALSKAVELYNVRLAKVKQVSTVRNGANRDGTGYGYGGVETQGGGYEFQFLKGQERARRTEDQLAESAVVLENVPPRYAYGTEGILQLVSVISRKHVNSKTILGIGNILDPASAKNDPLVMRHVVIVLDSEETAASFLSAIQSEETCTPTTETTQSYLRKRGCRARKIDELQSLRVEYLDYQTRAQQAASHAVQHAATSPTQSGPVQLRPSPPPAPVKQPSAAYPRECLIYLQNLPDNTNKTELKSLLDVFLEGDKVDYVDWKKGQISAYVRVVRPAHASMIMEGLENNASEGSMKAQLLKGEQEEIYWMKLPDKIRLAALQAQS